ncbi:hypothetical protein NM688_g1397 [Phlebia brevispora]|uniref:Uncharacterized protein n=1 Tax=Phlebia brevispora TaxID=194682 RepID=A0ACC1TBT0_9APHY|nr:hypothetical protein NM688_g1397 [Phlebia brevispora]
MDTAQRGSNQAESALSRFLPFKDIGTAGSEDILSCIEYLKHRFTTLNQSAQRDLANAISDLDDLLQLDLVDRNLVDVLAQVRVLRTASSPVMRLPCEVLAVIFEILQDDLRRRARCYPYGYDRPTYYWMRVLFVCRHWYDVAVSCTSLWATIFVDDLGDFLRQARLARRMLRNAQQHELSIYLFHPPANPDFDALLLDVLEKLQNVRELHLESVRLSVQAQQLLIRQPAPALRKLCIRVPANREPRVDLRPLFLGGHTPLLHTLALSGPIDYAWHSIGTLRHLYLERGLSIPGEMLLDFLEAAPALETLSMQSPSIVFQSGGDITGISSRHLSNVRRLDLDISYKDKHIIGQFLSHLELSTNVSLGYRIWGYPNPSHTSLHALFPNNFLSSRPILGAFNRLHMAITEDASFEVIAASDTSSCHLIFIPEFFSQSAFDACVSQLPPDISFFTHGVEEVWMDCCDYLTLENDTEPPEGTFYCDILSEAPALTRLFIKGHWTHSRRCLKALGMQMIDDGALLDLPCPQLRELHVLDAAAWSVEAAKDALQARIRGGFPQLEVIHIYWKEEASAISSPPTPAFRYDGDQREAAVLADFQGLAKEIIFNPPGELPTMQVPGTMDERDFLLY